MRFGKFRLLIATNLLLVIGNSLTQFVGVEMQILGRILWGMAAGVYTVLVPKYINETAPTELQGPFGTFSQIMVTLGILLVALLALRIPYFTFGQVTA